MDISSFRSCRIERIKGFGDVLYGIRVFKLLPKDYHAVRNALKRKCLTRVRNGRALRAGADKERCQQNKLD